jgi:hypothetical protein
MFLKGTHFESRPGHHISRLRVDVVFLSLSGIFQGKYFEVGNGRFLPNPYVFTIRYDVNISDVAVGTPYLNQPCYCEVSSPLVASILYARGTT